MRSDRGPGPIAGHTAVGPFTSDRSPLQLVGAAERCRGDVKAGKIERPVFYGENGIPTLRYEIDAYHPDWRCGLEVEAGRAWMGNAVYRDLIQAAVMVGVQHLCLAVSNS